MSSAANFSVSDGTHALKKLGLIALEQRILLDGAGFATGAEAAADTLAQTQIREVLNRSDNGETAASQMRDNQSLVSAPAFMAPSLRASDVTIEYDAEPTFSKEILATSFDSRALGSGEDTDVIYDFRATPLQKANSDIGDPIRALNTCLLYTSPSPRDS